MLVDLINQVLLLSIIVNCREVNKLIGSNSSLMRAVIEATRAARIIREFRVHSNIAHCATLRGRKMFLHFTKKVQYFLDVFFSIFSLRRFL